MTIEVVLFILFALTAAGSAVIMISRANPVISAIFLIINFFALAGLYLLLNAQFISVAQVIVYAGAIMVLFLFVLMLLNTKSESSILSSYKGIKIVGIVVVCVVFVQIAYIIFYAAPSKNYAPATKSSVEAGTIEQIGRQLYTQYILPFEVASFLLLASTIGAMVLAKKKFN